jgi:hypothetical protein
VGDEGKIAGQLVIEEENYNDYKYERAWEAEKGEGEGEEEEIGLDLGCKSLAALRLR